MPCPFLIFSQSDYLIKIVDTIHIFNAKQCRSRSVGFWRSQLIWIYTVCKDRAYPGSAGAGWSDMEINGSVIMKALCNTAPYSHELNSTSTAGIKSRTSWSKIGSNSHTAIRLHMDTSSTTEAILYGPVTDFGVYYILQYSLILYVDSEGPDQNVYMCRLIWAFLSTYVQQAPIVMAWLRYFLSAVWQGFSLLSMPCQM